MHLTFGANLPDAAIEVRGFFDDGLFDQCLREDVTTAFILVLSLEVRAELLSDDTIKPETPTSTFLSP